MKFFKDSYELDPSTPMGEEDPLVGIMENEFKGFLEENGYKVKRVYSEYEDYINTMSFDIENNKEIRLTYDDDGIPCIDVCGSEGDIIFTVKPKEEVDLHNFVKDLD